MNILEVSCFNIHMPCSYCIARYFVGGSIVLPYPENSDFLQNYTTDIANSKFFGRISTSKRYPFNSLHNNDKLWGRLNEYLSEVHARERGPQWVQYITQGFLFIFRTQPRTTKKNHFFQRILTFLQNYCTFIFFKGLV